MGAPARVHTSTSTGYCAPKIHYFRYLFGKAHEEHIALIFANWPSPLFRSDSSYARDMGCTLRSMVRKRAKRGLISPLSLHLRSSSSDFSTDNSITPISISAQNRVAILHMLKDLSKYSTLKLTVLYYLKGPL